MTFSVKLSLRKNSWLNFVLEKKHYDDNPCTTHIVFDETNHRIISLSAELIY